MLVADVESLPEMEALGADELADPKLAVGSQSLAETLELPDDWLNIATTAMTSAAIRANMMRLVSAGSGTQKVSKKTFGDNMRQGYFAQSTRDLLLLPNGG